MAETKTPDMPAYAKVVTSVLLVGAFVSLVSTVLVGSLEAQVSVVVVFWVLLTLGIFALIGVFIGKAALRKGRSFNAFFWLSLLVNPLIMAIVVAAISPVRETAVEQSSAGSDSIAGEIERLSALRDSGAISEAEFASAKEKLLEA